MPEPPQQGVDAEVEAPVLLFGLNVTGMPAEAVSLRLSWLPRVPNAYCVLDRNERWKYFGIG